MSRRSLGPELHIKALAPVVVRQPGPYEDVAPVCLREGDSFVKPTEVTLCPKDDGRLDPFSVESTERGATASVEPKSRETRRLERGKQDHR